MKPVVPYYGSKNRLAPWIVGMFPDHRVFVEPFAGSAQVLLAKPRCPHEVINDLDGGVVAFHRMLRDAPDELEFRCRLTPYARDEYAAADPDEEGISDLERARRFWVRCSQGYGGLSDASKAGFAVSIAQNSNDAQTAQSRVNGFAAVARRLSGVVIEQRDALEVIAAYDVPDGVIYVDSPYLGTTRTSVRDGRRPRGDYAHEFHTPEDHHELAEVLGACTATVFVSGYPSPLYDELYGMWDRAEREVVRTTSNGRGSGTRPYATEVVWSNRPIRTQLTLGQEVAVATSPGRRPIRLTFSAPDELLSMNKRRHRMEAARIAAEWRRAAGTYARQARRGRRGHLPPCTVTVHLPVKANRRRDPHNFFPTVKPIVDGLVDAGLWPDDTPEWVTTTEPVLEVGGTDVAIVLTIRGDQ